MTAKKTSPTAWKPGQSGNPKGRPPGVDRIRKLLEPNSEKLIKKAVDMALAGDVTALRLCLDRVAPLPRSEAQKVEIPGLPEAVSMSDKARTILDAAGNALISADVASMLLGAIANASRIIEGDELAARIAALEERADQ